MAIDVNVTLAAEVQVLHLEAGDVLVVKVEQRIPLEEEEFIQRRLQELWPDNRVVISNGLFYEVVR